MVVILRIPMLVVIVAVVSVQANKVCANPVSGHDELYYFLVINPYQHQDYGFSYPVTYSFYLEEKENSIQVYKKYHCDDSWISVESKISSDFFNGVEAFRYQKHKNMIYTSVAFGSDSDTLFLKFVNDREEEVKVLYQGITKYYDNRRAVVTSTADDWANWFDAKFQRTCRIFREHNLWVSPAVITAGCDSATWVHIQEQIDSGFVDVVSHSRTHSHIPYEDNNSEVWGSKWDLTMNLRLPETSRKGNQGYVYVWVAPYGSYNDDIDDLVSQNNYLVSRMYSTGDYDFSGWDRSTNKFHAVGVSREMGPLWAGTTDIMDLNSAFDKAYNSGGVYHVMCHPNVIEWDQAYPWLHMNYINNKTDVWYAGMGHIYVYHYLQTFASEFLTFFTSNEAILNQEIPMKIFPNPFRYETTIRYTLHERTMVQLLILDAMGRRVRIMVDAVQEKGPQEIILSGDGLNPGMYFYTLTTNTSTKSGRILKIE